MTIKDANPGMWPHLSILKIERVENGLQEDGNAEPYYKAGACILYTHTAYV